ncbi:MAG TPA: DUF1329 domain-containing protein [Candidatus Binatia bacterium]|nr:DUF1329 domain-containing protein [Candidatus Binatia bacterium]
MTLLLALSLALAALAGTARADVVPGDVITAENVDKVKDLVSPGLEWCIRRGWPITIIAPKRIEWPQAYREATEKYATQVRLAADGRTMENYVAGQPFPLIDPKDPQAAVKIMFNYDYNFFATDDVDLRNFDGDTGTIASHGPMTIERHFLIDHFRRLFWTGRLYIDPKPEKPNPQGFRRQEGLYPILEPYDVKGVGMVSNRYISPDKFDDSWLYLPSLRRVRRLSTSQRSDALFGQDTDVDSYGGYAGQIGWMDWKLLGEREVLGAVQAKHLPVKWHEKVDWAFDEGWEKRRVYVVEGYSKIPQYGYGKRVLYVDKEGWGVPYSDIYDRAGELWKIWINDVAVRRKLSDAPGAIEYPDAMTFAPAIVMVDVQLEHATRAALPSPRFPGEQGWYFNQGEASGVQEDWFTVAALVAAAH